MFPPMEIADEGQAEDRIGTLKIKASLDKLQKNSQTSSRIEEQIRVARGRLTELRSEIRSESRNLTRFAASSKRLRRTCERYYLKAMNCPHHHRIFAAEPRSYRDLPLRLAEYGTCYRYEQSGELFGLMRVRSLNMNDAHIYCTEEQFADEFSAVNEMYLKYFKIFGIEKYRDALQHARSGAKDRRQEIRQRTGAVEEDRGHGAPGVDRIRNQLRGGAERGGVLRAED